MVFVTNLYSNRDRRPFEASKRNSLFPNLRPEGRAAKRRTLKEKIMPLIWNRSEKGPIRCIDS